MVYSELRESNRRKIEQYKKTFENEISNLSHLIENEISKNLKNLSYAQELNFINQEIIKMGNSNLDDRDLVGCTALIKESEDMSSNLKFELLKIYEKYILIKSIEKNNIEKNIEESEGMIKKFLQSADDTMDLLIYEIMIYLEKDEKSKVLALANIKKQVEKMIDTLSKDKFIPFYGRIIVDSWVFDETLGEKLLALKNVYLKL